MKKEIFSILLISINVCMILLSCRKNSDSKPANRSPIANAGKDTIIFLPLNSTVLDASGSNDPDGTITKYEWSKISGPASFNMANAQAVQAELTNLAEGNYLLELKVTDNGGQSAKDTVEVIVNTS